MLKTPTKKTSGSSASHSTPRRKPNLYSNGTPSANPFSPNTDRYSSSQFANQDEAPPNDSFYLQVIIALVGSAAVVALIILQPILLEPALAITAVGIALGLYFFKKPELVEDTDDYNNLSAEIERFDDNLL